MSIVATPVMRPMKVAELLDAAIRFYRNNFLILIAIIAVVEVPISILTGLLNIPLSRDGLASQPYSGAFPYDTGILALMVVAFGVAGLLGAIGTSLMTAAVAWTLSERRQERPVSVGRAYRAALRRWRPLVAAPLLTALIYLGLIVLLVVPCLGQLVALPLFIFTVMCVRFAPQAIMVEGYGAVDGLKRSWYLAKPYFWRIVGIVALLALLSLALTSGPSYLVTFGAVVVDVPPVAQTMIAALAGAIVGMIYLPIQLAVETLLYYDLRVRQEGLDLELELDALVALPPLRADEDIAAPVLDRPAAEPPPLRATRESFLVGRDWRNLAILVGVGLGLIALCCLASLAIAALIGELLRPSFPSDFQQWLTATPLP